MYGGGRRFENPREAGELLKALYEKPQRAATAFLSLVVGGPARVIVSGNKLDATEVETHIRFAVDLFLRGVGRR